MESGLPPRSYRPDVNWSACSPRAKVLDFTRVPAGPSFGFTGLFGLVFASLGAAPNVPCFAPLGFATIGWPSFEADYDYFFPLASFFTTGAAVF